MTDATRSTTGYADVNGARLYYEVAGAGKPVVMLHAGIATSDMWEPQFAELATRYRVLRYDMRGAGRSSSPTGPASTTGDLFGLMDTLGMDRAALIGCSMGGGTVLDAALAQPERVAALVLVGSAISGQQPPVDELPPLIQQLIEASQSGDIDRVNELELRLWVDGTGRTPQDVNPAVRAKVSAMNRGLLERQAEADKIEWQPLEPPAIGRLEEVRAPALVIVGDRDVPFTVESAHLLAQRIPNAREVILHETAHVPNMERPEEFTRAVEDFFASVYPAS